MFYHNGYAANIVEVTCPECAEKYEAVETMGEIDTEVHTCAEAVTCPICAGTFHGEDADQHIAQSTGTSCPDWDGSNDDHTAAAEEAHV